MKAIACIWVVGMWYNIIAYRMLCAYLPLHRLWIWWAFCTGIAAAIVLLERRLLRRIRALLRHRHRWCSLLCSYIIQTP